MQYYLPENLLESTGRPTSLLCEAKQLFLQEGLWKEWSKIVAVVALMPCPGSIRFDFAPRSFSFGFGLGFGFWSGCN